MKYFITLTLFFSFLYSHSQITIKSQVITTKEKEPVGFVHIFNKNTHINSLSDSEGWFNIQAKITDTIVVKCIGFRTLTLPVVDINQKNTIELAEDTITLAEVTVSPINAYSLLLQV